MDKLLALCGEEVQDPDEELFLIFSAPIPSSNLGFLSSTSRTLTLSIASSDYEIQQSPGLLASNAASGTTGAVLWKITPLVAEWLASPTNPLFQHGVLSPSSHVLELGSGISGLMALVVGRRVERFVATDLDYVLKGLRRNLVENGLRGVGDVAKATKEGRRKGARSGESGVYQRVGKPGKASGRKAGEVLAVDLDWTTCTRDYLRENISNPEAVDCVLACDCIYNEALVEPFVQTCVDVCSLRESPPLCVVAQQLRSDLVFDAWLRAFARKFHVYRLPDELLISELHAGNGYVIHIGVLKTS